MQIATSDGGQPWICTVWFVADEANNLYWASLPSRRHSHEIETNSNVAGAIVVRSEIGSPVIGIQVEGTATRLSPSPKHRAIVENYAATFHRTHDWVEEFVAGRTQHTLYKLTPSRLYLFDEEHFPGGKRQEIPV